jgi:hypothetical protein
MAMAMGVADHPGIIADQCRNFHAETLRIVRD